MALRISTPLAVLTGAALLAASVSQASAAGGGARLEYEVWAGGVRVLEAEIVMRVADGRYRMELDAELVGPPSWVEEYSLKAFSQGVLGETGPEPEIYRQESDQGDKERWMQLAYADGFPEAEANFNLERKRQPVDDAMKQDSVDPLTGLLSLVLQVAGAGSCQGLVPVFDGRRRFDVVLTDQGESELPRSRYNAYEGPAQRCAVALKPIAGYRTSGNEQFPNDVVLQGAEIVPGLPALPVRLETKIAYGALLLHLVDYEAIDPDLD